MIRGRKRLDLPLGRYASEPCLGLEYLRLPNLNYLKPIRGCIIKTLRGCLISSVRAKAGVQSVIYYSKLEAANAYFQAEYC